MSRDSRNTGRKRTPSIKRQRYYRSIKIGSMVFTRRIIWFSLENMKSPSSSQSHENPDSFNREHIHDWDLSHWLNEKKKTRSDATGTKQDDPTVVTKRLRCCPPSLLLSILGSLHHVRAQQTPNTLARQWHYSR